MARSLSLAFLSLLFVGAVSAQEYSVVLYWIDRGPDDVHGALNEEIGSAFRNELKLRGIDSDGPGLVVYMRAQPHQTADGEVIVLSFVEGSGLSERMIEAGATAQIFYAGLPEAEDPDEARFVREYMTREVLSGQVQITNVTQVIFSRTDLAQQISSYLDDLDTRIKCMRPEVQCS
ncbi:MAG: hypothetical protein ACI80V_002909 [Rhodothermales bacterium]|jgi:hypothetical protein